MCKNSMTGIIRVTFFIINFIVSINNTSFVNLVLIVSLIYNDIKHIIILLI